MRFIRKAETPPDCIREFIDTQMQARVADPHVVHKIDYDSFTGKGELRDVLMLEQGSLCAYTGVGIDDRIANRRPRAQTPPLTDYWFTPHVEHLKPQAQCRRELERQGLKPGVDLGEDMDYRNMVAALQVGGTQREHFGAVARGDDAIDVWPTQEDCESRFRYDRNGGVKGADQGAQQTVDTLKLTHATLQGWRRAALDAFLDPTCLQTRADVEDLIRRVDTAQGGRLVEFCFVIQAAARAMLNSGS